MFDEKHPKGVDFPLEPAGKDARGIVSFMMPGDEVEKPGIEHPPLSLSRCLMSHVGQSAQFTHGPFPEPGTLRVRSLGKCPGIPDEVSEAGLPESHPLLVDPVTVAYEDALQSWMRLRKASMDRLEWIMKNAAVEFAITHSQLKTPFLNQEVSSMWFTSAPLALFAMAP